MRLIDADKLIEFLDIGHLRHPSELCFSEIEVANLLLHAPAVDAKPVVHGNWKFNHFYDEWECSECGSLIALSDDENGHPNFCPHCGADMRGEKND